MTNLIQEVKTALQAATPGPWKWEGKTPDVLRGENNMHIMDFGDNRPYYPVEGTEPAWDDYHLIANSPTWLQQLVDRLETAERHRDEAVKALETLADENNWTRNWTEKSVELVWIWTEDGKPQDMARTTLKRIKGENGHE